MNLEHGLVACRHEGSCTQYYRNRNLLRIERVARRCIHRPLTDEVPFFTDGIVPYTVVISATRFC